MPPKKATTSTIFVVINNSSIEGAYVSRTDAEARADDFKKAQVVAQELVGGSITVIAVEEKPAKSVKKTKAVKSEDEDEEKQENEAVKALAKKTKSSEEQRAANAKKPAKADDSDLPDNVKALLNGSGNIFEGQSIVVTGVPPVLGRKNADKLVELYGGKLVKAIAKKTSFVVLGNEAGPKKLDQINDFGLKSYTDTEFIRLIEEGAGGTKRSAGDEDEGDEDEKPAKKAAKKQKK